MKRGQIFIGSLLPIGCLAVVLAFGITGCKKGGGPGQAPQQTVPEKVKLELFVMSQCPFGVEAENGIAPVLKKFGGDVDFVLGFIGDSQADGKFTSMHGEKEVNGDKVQVCAIKHAPYQYMDMILCMNKNAQGIPDNWEDCAKNAGLPVEKIKTCYGGEEGNGLLKTAFEAAKAKNARGSPTIFINDKPYSGARSEIAFSRAICNAYPNKKPSLCDAIPQPVKVPITILSDKRCKDCNTDFLNMRLKQSIPSAEIKVVDWSDDEGKKLYADLKLTVLPVILMGKEIEKADEYSRFSRGLKPRGDYLELQIGAKFDPNKEICDNKTDDNNNGKIDCDDADCKNALVCRAEIPKKLDLFVMSQCPYGVMALNAVKEVLDNFKGEVNFSVHYIGNADGSGAITSMHGQGEVDEDIRELCAIKYYKKDNKFLDYILCRNKNIRDANWKECTGGNGIDTKKIETCSTGDEGKKMLREDLEIARSLDIGGSPTWLANNKTIFSGVDAESIKNNFCKSNTGMKNCDKKLSGPPAPQQGAPAPGGGCKQ
jgi:predicted DsbA family dithiol-disulfide isomerase